MTLQAGLVVWLRFSIEASCRFDSPPGPFMRNTCVAL